LQKEKETKHGNIWDILVFPKSWYPVCERPSSVSRGLPRREVIKRRMRTENEEKRVALDEVLHEAARRVDP
jgi:hypothetical protein